MTYYVYKTNLQAGQVSETAYVVTGAECVGEDPVGTYPTAEAAEQAAMSMASADAATGNEGCRLADGVVNADELAHARLVYQPVVEVYLSGAGQEVPDHEVADVLGSDVRDLMEGVEAATVAVAEVLINTGRWVTEGQYLLRLRNLHATHGGDEDLAEWARRHGSGEGLVAELVASAK